MNPIKTPGNFSNKFLVLDIKTYLKDGIHIPFVISYYSKVNFNSFSFTDYKNSEDMIINCIKEIMIKKYDNYKVYIHNLSGFNGNFLLQILVNLGEINPIIHENKIISITFKMNGYIVTFKDSQQKLISYLRNLGKCFGVIMLNSIFPYKFVN